MIMFVGRLHDNVCGVAQRNRVSMATANILKR